MRNPWLATLLGISLFATGCGAAGARASAPAADGVRTLIAALGQDNPAAGYALLSSQTRKQISFAEFSSRWKQTRAERTQHAKSLTDAIRIDAAAGERAAVRLNNGRVAYLVRTGASWSLETPLVATAIATKPRDAVQLFARAIAERDIGAILATLTKRRRDGLAQQIDGFIKGVSKHANDALSDDSPDRRTLRWDDGTTRYEVILRLEDDEWRVDDIVVREVPKVENDTVEGTLHFGN
ncbi:MAG: hypothetical protein KBG15_10650 [Kofleriaceae bacterium]|nr:hypothetical protein [Kofleriaceae bacterium]